MIEDSASKEASFGAKLRSMRKRKGITAQQAGLRLCLSQARLSKIETDIVPPPPNGERIERIGRALFLSAAEITELKLTARQFFIDRIQSRFKIPHDADKGEKNEKIERREESIQSNERV